MSRTTLLTIAVILLITAPGIVVLLLSSIAGIGTLLFHASRGADRLSEIEMESGVLLQLAPSGFAATIRGVTTYYDWEHVALHETPGGIAFVPDDFQLLACPVRLPPGDGNDSHAITIRNLQRAREVLGHDRVAAVMTTTKLSLGQPREIVDEYVRRDFGSIFLRSISPRTMRP